MTGEMLSVPSVLSPDSAERTPTEATPVCIVARGHHELIQGLRAVFGHSMHIIEDRRRDKALLPRDVGAKDMASGHSHHARSHLVLDRRIETTKRERTCP